MESEELKIAYEVWRYDDAKGTSGKCTKLMEGERIAKTKTFPEQLIQSLASTISTRIAAISNFWNDDNAGIRIEIVIAPKRS